jgi:diguanylate cyclase (GGDEF)-like protein
MFQAQLALMLLTCLPVAAEIATRNRLAGELLAREQQASQEAQTDPLTGTLNRRGFERSAAAILAQSGSNLCCVAIDVDRFKDINDRWGHQFGDHVLQHIAAVLRANTRMGDLIGRLGGDEFMLMLRASDQHPAEAVCARIQAILRATPVSADAKTEVMVGISCGVAAVVAGDRLDDVYRRADAALYEAKVAGRNTVRSA